MSNLPPLFDHQERDAEFMLRHPRVINASDAGTGKTRTCIEFIRRQRSTDPGLTLILATKSIMHTAWLLDFEKFAPEITVSLAYAHNRERAFLSGAEVIVTNHDGVKWISENLNILKNPKRLIIDESTAYGERTSQRSKAAHKVAKKFPYRCVMSATMMANSLLKIWHQTLIIDDGQRLSGSFYRFREATHTPHQKAKNIHAVEWTPKKGAEEFITEQLKDISIRNKLEECIDIPDNQVRYVEFAMNSKHAKAYKEFAKHAVMILDSGVVEAIHASSLNSKLLQTASGAVYDEKGEYHLVDTDRYELITDLIEEVDHSVVAFNWRHQRDQIVKVLQKRKITHGVIDGDASSDRRISLVDAYQKGHIQTLLIHPQSGGHGLTLTRGTRTIWASPTYNAELFKQLNHRIYRAGQKKKTETLLISAAGTIESQVYNKLQDKMERMNRTHNLIELLRAA